MRFIIGFVVTILLLILAVVLVIGGDNGDQNGNAPEDVTLSDYIDRSGSEVSYTVAGPIVAQENYREIRIIVTPSSRTVQIISGYDGTVTDGRDFGNTRNAYAEFLQALEQAGFAEVNDNPSADGPEGVCPTGRRHSFVLRAEDETVRDLWSVTCRGVRGSFAGQQGIIDRLFKAQIPDYNTIVRNVRGI